MGEAATPPVPEGVRTGNSTSGPVKAEATEQPPNGLEQRNIDATKAVA